MTDTLSRGAQSVMNHFLADVPIGLGHGLAAALRAMADHCSGRAHGTAGLRNGEDWDRRLLAIAAELEEHE